MGDYWPIASTYGPWLLAVAGVLVSFYRQEIKGWWRFIVIASFAALALLTNLGTQQTRKIQERQLTGGDCFITFQVIEAPSRNGSPYPLYLYGGCAPLFDVTYTITVVPRNGEAADEERLQYAMHPLKTATMQTVLTMAYYTGIDLPPGRYGINVMARNGMTFEILEIPEAGGARGQRFFVRKPTSNGLQLLVCVPEHDCDNTYPMTVVVPVPPP
jgi:hypothetical protein